MLKSALAAIALLATVSAANATVMIDSSADVLGTAGASGLSGHYYQATAGVTNFKIADTLAALASTPQSGTFTATSLNYGGNDTSKITDFLGADGASYKGRTPAAKDMSDGILEMTGFLYVASAGTYTFSMAHDDSAKLTIGGQTVFSVDCCTTVSADVNFAKAGYYAIDAIYSNTDYNNYTGGANFSLSENNAILTSSSLVQSVPEPASLSLLGAGLLGTLLVRRRQKRAAA